MSCCLWSDGESGGEDTSTTSLSDQDQDLCEELSLSEVDEGDDEGAGEEEDEDEEGGGRSKRCGPGVRVWRLGVGCEGVKGG